MASRGGESIFDSEVVPPSLVVEIAPILRAANEVEPSNPRVAFLCRFYALDKAHRLDPPSIGRGVLQFKIALMIRVEREKDPTLMGRVKESDASEMQSFYHHYYKKYIQALQNAAGKADRAQLTKAYETANVLCEVLKAINQRSVKVDRKTISIGRIKLSANYQLVFRLINGHSVFSLFKLFKHVSRCWKQRRIDGIRVCKLNYRVLECCLIRTLVDC